MRTSGSYRSKNFKDNNRRETDGLPRACKIKQAFSYCLASILVLCSISFIIAAVAEWIFEVVLEIRPHFVELWLGITAFLLGMWGMEHVFAVPHLKLSQDSASDEESVWRSRHSKNVSKDYSDKVKRPSGVVFSAAEKAERRNNSPFERYSNNPVEKVETRNNISTESSSNPLSSEKIASKTAASTATLSQGKSEKKNHVICEVWAGNFNEEFAKMLEITKSSKYIAIDTEFPGFVLEGCSEAHDPIEVRNYAALRENVNTLKLIQLGLAFADNSGEFGMEGANCFCWQFNFKFNVYTDTCSQDSIQMLTAANVDWERHRREGISMVQFGDKLNASGMVTMIKNMGINWISFHGGYDFAFMLKLFTLWRMPETLEGFVCELDEYFPNRCDLKYQLQLCSGLSSLANQYNVQRSGQPHQAGSDALLTCSCFFKLDQHIRDKAFDPVGICRSRGALFGLVPNTLVSFRGGYNGSRIVPGRREQHDAPYDSGKEHSYRSTGTQSDTGEMWTKRQVLSTLLRLAHDPERVVANAANKALSLIQKNTEDSDVSEHLKDLAMADRIEAAQKQAIHKVHISGTPAQKQAIHATSTHKWNTSKTSIAQKIPRSFVPNMMQYEVPMVPMVNPHHHQYMMQAPLIYDPGYHEAWEMQKRYIPRQPYYWGRR